ncbi:hypothetical protein GCM10027570_50840 [Streptomonospora sediminis]
MGDSDDVAANANDAGSKGGEAVTVAETFQGLRHSFTTAVDFLNTVAADEGIKGAFSAFGEAHIAQMQELQTHGERMGGNIQAGATRVSITDIDNHNRYNAASTDGDTAADRLLSRFVNDSSDRYVP